MDSKSHLEESAKSVNHETIGFTESIKQKCLLNLLDDYKRLTGKQVRSQGVHIGFLLGHPNRESELASQQQSQFIEVLKTIIENLHLGSLIIDDIEDQSEERRGEAALYKTIGTGRAINAGNYLYFSEISKLKSVGLSAEIENMIYRSYFDILTEAHEGQAADLCYRMLDLSKEEQIEVSKYSLDRKTGSLMALAFGWGAIANFAPLDQLQKVMQLGRSIGVTLQMFDDIGNLNVEHSGKKHLEDLINQKPSYVWQIYSKILDTEDQSTFLEKVKLLNAKPHLELRADLVNWLSSKQFFEHARAYAHESLLRNINEFENNFSTVEYPKSYRWIISLLERIKISYGK